MKFKRTSIVALIASLFILSVIIAGCGGGSSQQPAEKDKPAEPVKWTANSVWPPENHQSVGLQEFADRVKEATEGQVDITVSTGGALGYKGPELLKVVRDGLVPVSDMLTSGVAGDEPIFELVTLPFLIQSFEEGKVLNDIARPYFDQLRKRTGTKKYFISHRGRQPDCGPRERLSPLLK